MTSSYNSIHDENLKRYGTDITRIAPMLLAERYDDRTHFIFELLQNAEDALLRRGDWEGNRQVSFKLTEDVFTLSHFGKPFDEADVMGVCGIAQSTKDERSIGRFGIGFKSVYTFTKCPRIHSGDENFEIHDYVLPSKVARISREPEETLIVLPLGVEDKTARTEIADGLKKLGPRSLLFLRAIEEVNWLVQDVSSGTYLRSKSKVVGSNVHRVNLIGQESGHEKVDEHWLVFHKRVHSPEGMDVGRVEVAFLLRQENDEPDASHIAPVPTSPLVAFFPTTVETNLGFLIQGPYRTTPSRDNIPRKDLWNKYLIEETATLLIDALRWLKNQSLLDTSTLSCLPLDRDKFPEDSMFAPLFDAVRDALLEEALLPRFGGGYIAAGRAKLGRTKDLRELFDPTQITTLFDEEVDGWISGEVTQDRAPDLRRYLMQELEITEVTPATIMSRLSLDFLEAQEDEWILKLYEFLNGQGAALRASFQTAPLVRLDNGTHVTSRKGERSQAFLPSSFETNFPTVSPSVCATDEAREFLTSLGISEPDIVDDVIFHVLPAYERDEVDTDKDSYSRDIGRVLAAYQSDSKSQREKLVKALRNTPFVMALDSGDGTRYVSRPGSLYIATGRLKKLFSGVTDVMIVDESYECLRGDSIRELLESCGALRYPRPVEAFNTLSGKECLDIRISAGYEQTSGRNDTVVDWTLDGFDGLMRILPELEPDEGAARARLIWESLGDLEERRGRGVFDGLYRWTHYGNHEKDFPSAFIRRLNTCSWVPDKNGTLQQPSQIVFEDLGWKANPFLVTKIHFKPPVIDQLAREAGIEPEALDLLRRYGITSVSELKSRLGITELAPEIEQEAEPEGPNPEAGNTHISNYVGDPNGSSNGPGAAFDQARDDGVGQTDSGASEEGQKIAEALRAAVLDEGRRGVSGTANADGGGGANNRARNQQGGRSPEAAGGRQFISYLGLHPDDEVPDPDGLDQLKRMQLESMAIKKVLTLEPCLQQSVAGNKGFDLYETDVEGNIVRWVEVKSMTGSLKDRPVGMSRAQFDFASEKGESFWLYVVEHASEVESARVIKIQDPAGRARTFTYDSGWLSIAEAICHIPAGSRAVS